VKSAIPQYYEKNAPDKANPLLLMGDEIRDESYTERSNDTVEHISACRTYSHNKASLTPVGKCSSDAKYSNRPDGCRKGETYYKAFDKKYKVHAVRFVNIV
jgi:2-oxoglutarate dehydrogenase complex dehydrogenase (E1) component-like enzyme